MKTGAGRGIQEGHQVGASFLTERFAKTLPVVPVERIGSAIIPFAGKRTRKSGGSCSAVACYRELT